MFGIGHDLNPVLLDRLGEENRGSRDYVDEREDLEVKVSGFYEKISNPILSDVKVTFEGVAVDEVYPKTLPDLFRGSQLLLTGRFKGEGEVKVQARGQGRTARRPSTSFALKAGGSSKQPSLPRLWAVRKVGYLLDQIRLNGEQKELKDEVVRLGDEVRHRDAVHVVPRGRGQPVAGTGPPSSRRAGWWPRRARRSDLGAAASGCSDGGGAAAAEGRPAEAPAPAADEALKRGRG